VTDKDQLAGSAGAAIPGLIAPGPLGAALGLLTGELSRRAWVELKLLWSRPMKAAVRISGLSREELEERIRDDPRLVPLAARVLHEAAMTGCPEVLDLLGAALGDGVIHPDQSDDTELILGGLARLRPVHIRLIRHLGPEAPDADGTWTASLVGEREAVTEDEASRLLFDLAAAGFMTMHNAWNALGFTVSGRGVRLLEVIDALDA